MLKYDLTTVAGVAALREALLENPTEFYGRLLTASGCLAAEQELLEAIESIAAAERQVEEESTAAKRERLRLLALDIRGQHQQIRPAKSRLLAQIPRTDREMELTSLIKDSLRFQTSIASDVQGGVPAKYLRPDAVSFHGKESGEAKSQRAKLEAKINSFPQSSKPSGRLIYELKELDDAVAKFEKLKPTVLAGQRIAIEREKMQALVAERDALVAKRKQLAGAV